MELYRGVSPVVHRSRWAMQVGRGIALAAAAACCVTSGCGRSRVPQERVIHIRQADPAAQVRSYLEGYVQGQRVGSERELFSQFVSEIRLADPDLAGVVEQGLAEIQAAPGQAGRIAKKLLERLEPAPQP